MSYARFYTLLKRVHNADEAKVDLVSQFTHGRTTSLREMTPQEYDAMCNILEERLNWMLRKKRSLVLKLMQELGVDTTDWGRINAFCLESRIAGKPFAKLTSNELEALAVRLRAIIGKGGLKAQKHERHPQVEVCFIMNGKIRAEA